MIDKLGFMRRAVEENRKSRKSGVDLDAGAFFVKEIRKGLDLDERIAALTPEAFMASDFDAICKEVINEAIGALSDVNALHSRMGKSEDIVSFVRGLEPTTTTEQFFLSFVARARKVFLATRRKLQGVITSPDEDLKDVVLHSYKDILPKDKLAAALFFQRQKFLNWLMLGGFTDLVPYDTLHELDNGAYNFSTKVQPNVLARQVAEYKNGSPECIDGIIKGKKVLCLADGNGLDAEYFLKSGAREVIVVDSSPLMFSRQKDLKKSLDAHLEGRFHLSKRPVDMMDYLEYLKRKGETVDTMFGHSMIHYFEDDVFKKFLRLIMDVLNERGHLALAIKAPGAFHDGNGIPLELYENKWVLSTKEDGTKMMKHEPIRRVWLNDDGQTRYFRPMEEMIRIFQEFEDDEYCFVPRVRAEQDVENYDLNLGLQKFYLVILKKMPKKDLGN